jgi:hypothetical protein
MRSDHRGLLGSAGFGDITKLDVTPEFRATAAAVWLAEAAAHAGELARLEAPGAFEQRQGDRGPCWPRSTLQPLSRPLAPILG